MSFEQAKRGWIQITQNSIADMERMFSVDVSAENVSEEEKQFQVLAKWMLDTKVSPCEYLTGGWESFFENVSTANGFFRTLHHALVDDGDFCFVRIHCKDELIHTYLVFDYWGDPDFEEWQRKWNAQLLRSYIAGSESRRRVLTSLNEEKPERNIAIPDVLKDSDFKFTAHNEVAVFMEEVEALVAKKGMRRELFDEKMRAIRRAKS